MRRHKGGSASALVGVAVVTLSLLGVPADAGGAQASLRSQATNSIGLRLVDIPEAAGQDPRARLYIVDRMAPGSTIVRRIEVSNTTSSTAHVQLYAAAASIKDGTFVGAEGRTPNELTTWTSLTPSTVDVAAGGTSLARVSIAVPADAVAGEQYGAVWAEVSGGTPSGGGVTQVSRVGIRLYLSVGPGGGIAPDFQILSMDPERMPDGHVVVMASVRNTGGRALDLVGDLDLTGGPGGVRAGPFTTASATTVAIGATAAVPIVLDQQLPAGPWTATVALRSGLLERTASGPMTLPGGAPATATTPWWWIALLAVLALALAALALVLLARRRQRLTTSV